MRVLRGFGNGAARGAGFGLALPIAIAALAGCNTPGLTWWPAQQSLAAPATTPQAQPASAPPAPLPTASLADDHPLQLVSTGSVPNASPELRLDAGLSVLHVQVPAAARAQTASLWNHVQEDLFDQRTALRLTQNGLRVGRGHAQFWDAVKAVLDAVPGVRSIPLAPVRLPPGYPLALELDEGPRGQTLFYVGDDGVLSGASWPASRNVLRVSYLLDLAAPERARLTVVPEVRQKLEGWRWVRTDQGLAKEPEYSGRAFGPAGFVADLSPDEFLVVAPGPDTDVYGLVGSTFLRSDQGGERYDSYVFLRMELTHVAQHH